MLATPPEKENLISGKKRLTIYKITADQVTFLEKKIDQIQKTLPEMTHFILPGGHQTVSFCHISRCVCRRVERLTVQLHEKEPVNEYVLTYLNRLSDYLFVLARKLTIDNKAKEIPWIAKKEN